MDPIMVALVVVVAVAVVVFLAGIRVVRPTHRGLIERLGKYRRFAKWGFNWIIPIVDRMIQVNVIGEMAGFLPMAK